MGKKMLIDAAHPEETRVAVLKDNRVEEFDFESATKNRFRGNIYLAKVTRIEPSLQAAFVDYGGNRHGFLAFNEIHPDYFQIPAADRAALFDAELPARIEEPEGLVDDESDTTAETVETEAAAVAEQDDGPDPEDDAAAEAATGDEDVIDDDSVEIIASDGEDESDPVIDEPVLDEPVDVSAPAIEAVRDDEDMLNEIRRQRRQKLRSYKIQEVIKRRQVILVQVVKEERGNKGAALTTYLSLAGRYCVLMPNTGRGGGISRKITSLTDRKRLKKIVESLDLPDGMGLIIRTAGSKRTKSEIKRDYEYLMRLWENVRSLTLESNAPSLVYEEGNLVKRVLRDLYDKDIDEVLVEGEETYKEAKSFMKMMMPSHAKNIKRYKNSLSLFQRYHVERQLDQIYSPQVQLKSGGYLVINPTEALVSIDVNSGRATKERNIENTALQTNLEAAEEVARQCRLRDLAGLLVIDFIDMEENRNNRAVEKRLKDSMKQDRARVQVGRISNFGLLEMSRQRMRASVLEGQSTVCSSCNGTGMMRSTESTVLRILRAVEEQAIDESCNQICLKVSTETALYLFNHKRRQLQDIEDRHKLQIDVETVDTYLPPQFEISRGAGKAPVSDRPDSSIKLETPYSSGEMSPAVDEELEEEEKPAKEGRGRRRRRRRGKKSDKQSANRNEENQSDEEAVEAAESSDQDRTDGDEQEKPESRRRRRRGKRGGRKQARKRNGEQTGDTAESDQSDAAETNGANGPDHSAEPVTADAGQDDHQDEISEPVKASKKQPAESPTTETDDPAVAVTVTDVDAMPKKPAKRGWWQRRSV